MEDIYMITVGGKRLIGPFEYLYWARGPVHGKTPHRPRKNPPLMDKAEGKRGNRPSMAKLQTIPQGRESTKVEKDDR